MIPAKSRKEGFSLVEILAAVAIMAVLASLLLPAYFSARRRAKMVQSLQNLSQLGIGIREFAADNQQRLPGVGSGPTSRWVHMIAPYVGIPANGNVNGIPVYNLAYGKSIFHTPMTPSSAYSAVNSNGCYGLNEQVYINTPDGNALLGCSLLAVTRPASTVLLAELSCLSYKGFGAGGFQVSSTAPYPSIAFGAAANYRDDGKPQNGPSGAAVYLFMDGHTEILQQWPVGKFSLQQ